MALLQSVNIGTAEKIPAGSALTGIFKRPCAGPLVIGRLGLEGDAVLDRRHHGGLEQAAYIYFADDYDWWSAELGQGLVPGTFGENLTIAGVEGRSVAVGDRLAIGRAVLEVTSHRTPRMTLAARMGDRGFVRRFHKAGRPGAYCRVIMPGAVSAGDGVVHQRFAGEAVTVSELMALDGVRDIAPETLRRALSTPLHSKMREDYEHRLARLF